MKTPTTKGGGMPAGFVNKHKAAEMLGVCTRTVDNLVRHRAIAVHKIRRRIIFKETDVLAALAASRIPAVKEPKTDQGILMPADDSFEAVNRFVHNTPAPEYEELQWALLGMAGKNGHTRLLDAAKKMLARWDALTPENLGVGCTAIASEARAAIEEMEGKAV